MSRIRLSKTAVTTRRRLRDRGVTAAVQAVELDAGRLIAIGRSRLARPDCPPEVVRAAGLGGRAACITAARLLELWVLDDGRLHLSVPRNQPISTAALSGERIHWVTRSVQPPHPDAGLESLRDMLRHIAECQPLDRAVVVFDSAVRKGLIDVEELRQLGRAVGGRMRRATELTNELADSGLETLTRLGLLERGIHGRQQVVLFGRPVDFLIGDRLVVQCDGFDPHNTPRQRERDLAQDRYLQLRGYHVLRYGYEAIVHQRDTTIDEITAAVAQGLHVSRQAV